MLQTYRAKRKFDITAEPRGRLGRRQGDAFVIQKHAARRLHYDLRLELDGVMKSWAVARGPSLVPGEKRLAIQVEDHPVDYNRFEGIIPKGQYGGGTVMIWDRGRWLPDEDPHTGYERGRLSFHLEGEKLKGGWHLVRMRKRPGERQIPWLLIKAKDEEARSRRAPDILEEKTRSAATGRTLDEIAQGKKPTRRAGATKAAAARGQATRARNEARALKSPSRALGRSATPSSKTSSTTSSAKRTRSRKTGRKEPAPDWQPLPDFVPPCLAKLGDTAPGGSSWVHEIKFDGYRIQARLDHRNVRLLTRQGIDWTARFAPIAEAIGILPATQALLDGEIVAEDPLKGATFSLLQQDLKQGRRDRLVYYVFDLLHRDGQDLRGWPLIDRQDALRSLLPERHDGPLRASDHSEEPGPTLLRYACEMGLEGIVSKRSSAPYRSGRTGDWVKTKCSDQQEFVIAGYAPSSVDSRAIGALILGYYDNGTLRYAGRTGTGFSRQVARDLWTRLQPLRLSKPPFGLLPKEETRARNALWVEPRTVAEADFRGWTHGGLVRQASFKGVREDKPARDVVREVKAMPTRSTAASAAPRRSARQEPRRPNKGPSVSLSHPDRVYWDDVGVTKQDLADYYVKVWEWMRPHIVGRPLALLRCPEGASAECFFQKHASAGVATEHLHLVPEPDGDEVITIDDLDGLISLVQAGVLEVHTRGSTAADLERCDRLVFDLDPGPGVDWPGVVRSARDVRDRLAAVKLTSFIKTSGGKGLHVVVPIRPVPWDAAKDFAESIARAMAEDAPDIYTSTVSKKARNQRIFVDYLRNSREATAVAPYSTRARSGAPVSTPITWDELGPLKAANRYTVLNIGQRLGRLGKDPWAEIAKIKQAIPAGRSRTKK